MSHPQTVPTLTRKRDFSTMSRHGCTSAALFSAYHKAEYRVLGDKPFTLKIGQHSKELGALMDFHGVGTAAFITADNPWSQRWSDAENADRRESLRLRLLDQGAVVIEGVGVDPEGEWPGEISYLALGISFGWAHAYACSFGQNAFVFIDLNQPVDGEAIPELVLTSGDHA